MEKLPDSVTRALSPPRFNRWWMVAFVIALLGFLGSGGIPDLDIDSRQAARVELDGIADQVEELYQELGKVDDQGLPVKSSKVFEDSGTATGAMKVLQDFVASVMNQTLELQNDYIDELEAINWFYILDAARISQDTDFLESATIISNTRSVLSENRELSEARLASFRDEIDSLPFTNEALRQTLISSFGDSIEKHRSSRNRVWELEEMAIDEIEKIIQLLEYDREAWVVEDGGFVFFEGADTDTFNKHLANVDNFVDEQTQIQQRALQETRRVFQESF